MKLLVRNHIYPVPTEIITSVSLSFDPMTGVVGDFITAKCTVELNYTISGCDMEFDYGFITNTDVAAGAGLEAYNFATISLVNISSAGEYTCTATVTGGDFCQGVGSEQLFIPRTSDAVTLRVQCA